jgi:hypothetical protein
VKRPFSSSSSDKGVVDWQAQKAIFLADLEANKANAVNLFMSLKRQLSLLNSMLLKLNGQLMLKPPKRKLKL